MHSTPASSGPLLELVLWELLSEWLELLSGPVLELFGPLEEPGPVPELFGPELFGPELFGPLDDPGPVPELFGPLEEPGPRLDAPPHSWADSNALSSALHSAAMPADTTAMHPVAPAPLIVAQQAASPAQPVPPVPGPVPLLLVIAVPPQAPATSSVASSCAQLLSLSLAAI